MRAATRLGSHTTALTLVFVVAWAAGTTRPADVQAPAAVTSAGLVASASGYSLVSATGAITPGTPTEFAFTITGPDARPVTAYDAPPEAAVVRRDGAGFQRLKSVLGADGVWRAAVTLPAGGGYRVYVEFVPVDGPVLTLGADLFAPGDFTPIPLPPSRVSQVEDYQVRLDGALVAGRAAPVFVTVTRGGLPVTDLEPYRGGFGRLVALRLHDLAHLPMRPDAVATTLDRAGPGIAFVADVPTPGRYRLILDFRHAGVVRTVEFTVDAS